MKQTAGSMNAQRKICKCSKSLRTALTLILSNTPERVEEEMHIQVSGSGVVASSGSCHGGRCILDLCMAEDQLTLLTSLCLVGGDRNVWMKAEPLTRCKDGHHGSVLSAPDTQPQKLLID